MHKKFSIEQSPRRRAFTLVELLLVITVIAILASLGVGVIAQAQNDAAVAATRSRITLIEKLLEVELEDYEVRRSPVSSAGLGALVALGGFDDPTQVLLHGKILRRMIIADLIRAEMPDGAVTSTASAALVAFPSEILLTYMDQQFGIPPAAVVGALPSPVQLPGVSRWTGWTRPVADSNLADEVIEDAADRSEILYQNLLNIDIDGVPAVELLGPSTIGDSDGDGVLEVLDGWREPLFLEWQQERLVNPDPELNIWSPTGTLCGLSCEHISFASASANLSHYSQPVLPSQLRPRITSERLFAIDGDSADYAPRRGLP